MIKLRNILFESVNGEEPIDILKSRRSKEERDKNYAIAVQKYIQDYINKGSRGDLELYKMPIKELPKNLKTVGGFLMLQRTQIRELPDNLVVKGTLNVSDTNIEKLPVGLIVDGDVFMNNTPLSKKYSEEELKQLLPGVTGNIYSFYD